MFSCKAIPSPHLKFFTPRYNVDQSPSTPGLSGGSDTTCENESSCPLNSRLSPPNARLSPQNSRLSSSSSGLNLPHTGTTTRTASRMGRRNIKVQVKRFRMETKAAKTLGIIVGVFILCWLPFFCMYLVRGFCPQCINSLLFSILFWLGYCNSAINPFIYALFSKDFRFAFKTILCKCVCQKVRNKAIRRAPTIYIPSYNEDSEEVKTCVTAVEYTA